MAQDGSLALLKMPSYAATYYLKDSLRVVHFQSKSEKLAIDDHFVPVLVGVLRRSQSRLENGHGHCR